MKLTAEDYKRNYREMSDEEFLTIDRDELVEVARRCYDAELTRRQLTPEAPAAVAEPDTETPTSVEDAASEEDLVQVGLVADRDTAIYAQKLLQDADIPAFLTPAPEIPGIYSAGSMSVRVPVSCIEAARDLLTGVLTGSNKILAKNWLEKDWKPDGMDLSDFSVTIDDYFGEEDKVAVRMTVEGVNPQTGRDVRFGGIAIVRVEDGKIAETWIKLDA